MAAVFVTLVGSLRAQLITDTAHPIRPSYGWPIGDFFVGVGTAGTPWQRDSGGITDDLWYYVHRDGGNMSMILSHRVQAYDEAHRSIFRDSADRALLLGGRAYAQWRSGFGREVQFYPFDSVQSPFYVCRFDSISGGARDSTTLTANLDPRFKTRALWETRYDSSNTAPGQLIAARPLFGVDTTTGNGTDANEIIATGHDLGELRYNRFYVAVTGHLFEDGPANLSDSLLALELWHTVPAGRRYLDTLSKFDTLLFGVTYVIKKTLLFIEDTAHSDTAFLLRRWYVTKAQLSAGAPGINLARYREVLAEFDLDWRGTNLPGPTHPKQPNRWDGSRQLDLRVYWTGKEEVALRSISMRDSLGQHVLGQRSQDKAFRTALMDDLWRKLYGTSSHSVSPDSLRTEYFRIQCGHEAEHVPTEYAGFEWMNLLFRDSFNLSRKRALHGEAVQPGDSMPAWQQNFGSDHFLHMTTNDDITWEASSGAPNDTSAPWGITDTNFRASHIFETPHNAYPRFSHHGGGRGHLPLLIDTALLGDPSYDATLQARVDDYETTMQNLLYGRNDPAGMSNQSRREKWGFSGLIANSARLARRSGRRIMMFYYFYTHIEQRYDPATHTYDTLLGPRMEPSEVRAMANIALCNGVHSIAWMNLANNPRNVMAPLKQPPTYVRHDTTHTYDTATVGDTTIIHDSLSIRDTTVTQDSIVRHGGDSTHLGDTVWVNSIDGDDKCCFGSNGLYSDADTVDVMDYALYKDDLHNIKFTLPNYYVGYKTVMAGLRDLNKSWIRTIGPEMSKLRWRNSYSINYTTGRTDAVRDTFSRPLPAGELVRGIRTYDRFGRLDSLDRTYVELGLFDPKPGAGGYDTNYIYLVNRRSFEAPTGLSAAKRKQLDSLSGWRKLYVNLDLSHPDVTRYNFVRVTEVLADSARTPWDTASRRGLDTMIAVGPGGDSAFAVWMGPGRAGLFRVTYIAPDPSNITGSISFNNQRHIMWDGRRWHAAYALLDANDSANSGNSSIVYMWSKPVDSANTTVRWDSSYILSIPNISGVVPCLDTGSYRTTNRHPSLTVYRSGDTARVTVVWTCHKPVWATGPGREVVARSLLLIDDTTQPKGVRATMGVVRHVDYYLGYYTAPWGTPVVSLWHGGELFAWSDSLLGIVAKLRLNAGQWNSCAPDIWSNTLHVANDLGYSIYPPGQFPTMAPLAHIHGRDSSNGLAWQQPVMGGMNDIVYSRIVMSPSAGFPPAPTITEGNWFVVNDQLGPGKFTHPSMDLWQHPFDQCNEGITWEEKGMGAPEPRLWYRSLNTIISYYSAPDTIRPVNGWNYHSHWLPTDPADPSAPHGPVWPNIGAMNNAWDPATQYDSAYMAIAYEDSVQDFNPMWYHKHQLWEIQLKFGDASVKGSYPKQYSFDGRHAAMSASQTRQAERAATLYETHNGLSSPAPLLTTRQFFARGARPRGYLAVGRELVLLDSLHTGGAAGLMDVWVSDDDSARSLGMTARDTTTRYIDTLAIAEGLVRSASFQTHDSVVVGLRSTARFIGDSADASARGVAVRIRWELIDETSTDGVALLDSTTLDAEHPQHDSLVTALLDVVSGSYHVRMTADTVNITPRPLAVNVSRWPVVETSTFVGNNLVAKVVRTGEAEGARARLSVQPNPATEQVEVMVSVPEASAVRVMLYTVDGKAVSVVYEGELKRGRYSLPCSVGNLPAGNYLVEFVAGRDRLTHRLIVR